MTDPLERLREFDPGPPTTIPTAAAIRLRGDRLRRRRHGVGLVAVATIVAALVVPVALLTGDGEVDPVTPAPSSPTSPASPTPTTGPTETEPAPSGDSTDEAPPVPTSIPDDFPLIDGWPDPDAAEPGPGMGITGPRADLADALFDYTACGQPLPTAATPTARRQAIYRNVEDTRTRQLLTFDDAESAVAFMGGLVTFYRACPQEAGGAQEPAFRRAVVATGIGGQSYAVGAFPPPDQPVGSTQVLHAIRTGSAILLDTTAGEGGTADDIEALTRQRARVMAADSRATVEAMCLYTVAGC